MWIDTHCHLEAEEFAGREETIAAEAAKMNIRQIVFYGRAQRIGPGNCLTKTHSVDRSGFERVSRLAHACDNCSYAVGIHPMYVADSHEDDLAGLKRFLEKNISDPKLVAIGEIGLDFYVPELNQSPLKEKQEYFLSEQLKMAKEFDLPVLLHTRRSVDMVLKYLRRHNIRLGIAHAFNGSFQQAKAFTDLGFMLSFCGTSTYERAQQLRKLVSELPEEVIVIETDSPDLPPSWLQKKENSPLELPRIGEVIAGLRGVSVENLADFTSRNAMQAIPRLVFHLSKG